MSILILKRLRQSELGWFDICRRQGRETGRQRGLNLDADILDSVFSPGNQEVLYVQARWFNGEAIVGDRRPIRLQQKNWRLTGEAIKGDHFEYVKADDIVFLWYQPHPPGSEAETVGILTWEVLSQNNRMTLSLYRRCSAILDGESARLVDESELPPLLRLARRRLPVMGGNPNADTGDLTDDDWDAMLDWLTTWLKDSELRELLKSGFAPQVNEILKKLREKGRSTSREALATDVLRLFGTELLTDADRRKLLLKARFRGRESDVPRPPERWTRGGKTATTFVQALELPVSMAGSAVAPPDDIEDVDAFQPLGPLHDFQLHLAERICEVLRASNWKERRGIVWLPTGCGKTRVMVESLLDYNILEAPRNCLLWIADRDELCEQAVETFRHVWRSKGILTQTADAGGQPTLRIIRQWGGRNWHEPPTLPTVIIASIQTLYRRLEDEAFQEELAILSERCAAIVFDEAHHVVAPSYGHVIQALGLSPRENYLKRKQQTAPPLFGLTATPARSNDDETQRLSARFMGKLIEPDESLRSLSSFQKAGYLSHLDVVTVKTHYSLHLKPREVEQLSTFQSIPSSAIKRAGEDAGRTAIIIRDLEKRLLTLTSVLVFACSVEHSSIIAEVLLRRGIKAAHLDGTTPRATRWHVIQQFRNKALQVLVNCDLLATGFDAPNIDAVVIARPVASRVLFAQMVGRGLRGPRNGGTGRCTLIDYQDNLSELGELEQLWMDFRQEFLAMNQAP